MYRKIISSLISLLVSHVIICLFYSSVIICLSPKDEQTGIKFVNTSIVLFVLPAILLSALWNR